LKFTKNKGICPNEQQLCSIAANTQFSILSAINDAKFHANVRLIISTTTDVLTTFPNALLIITIIIHLALVYVSIISIISIAIIPNSIVISAIFSSMHLIF